MTVSIKSTYRTIGVSAMVVAAVLIVFRLEPRHRMGPPDTRYSDHVARVAAFIIVETSERPGVGADRQSERQDDCG